MQLRLEPLSVMIGANGSGKTSVLGVFSLLASSAQGKLGSAISDLSGLGNVITYDHAKELKLQITMEVSGHEPLEYGLCLGPRGLAYSSEGNAEPDEDSPSVSLSSHHFAKLGD